MTHLKYVRLISWLLGISLFMFGFLKFFQPFKGWYTVQIEKSELGALSYIMGIAGELSVGISLILVLVFEKRASYSFFKRTIVFASVVIIVMMFTGVYVHLHPAVPNTVLPMDIKAPYIPTFFIALAVVNIILLYKRRRRLRPMRSNW